ncbi:sulfotransferase [Pseudomonas sp. ZM23]|uniref:Sulfotransferase n=1 Tax=Pseudomonas triclosanedens TaxID=2961893 RepID=A0ABY7A361_9PSED|nr:sulfotransferase [Pseudomonas triclosanedens]MCP8464773.1 sulfotransferase [Pseudomonas triclosanedens]MCP8470514.1 sulfotransferase [Pseudomonas triclosanedens]MCP8476320.1 sulfotransferase [Pseudomonas triclosanedens]WAI51451.1 sulfotransferase [Pseudomonas triclosanedens]
MNSSSIFASEAAGDLPEIIFVVHGGDLEAKAALLAATLRARLGFGFPIVAAVAVPSMVWGELSPSSLRLFSRLQVTLRLICNVFGASYPIGNKFSALSLGRDDRASLFLDSDMYCMSCPDFSEFHSYSAAFKPADMALVPTSTGFWKHLYSLWGMDVPLLRVIASVSGELMPPYFNAGFMWLRNAADFSTQWLEIAQRIAVEPEVEYRWPWLDQLSLPIAAAYMRLSVKVLCERYNYPLHLKPLPADRTPYFCHYHDPSVLSREPSILRDLYMLQMRWPELGEVLSKFANWKPVLDDMRVLMRCHGEYAGENLIITGPPRSGTSFLCRVLSERLQTVIINEPAEIFQALSDAYSPWGLPHLYANLRREVTAGRPVMNKHVDGRLVSDTAREPNIAAPYIAPIRGPGFTLGTKNTLAYLSRLPSLLRVMPDARVVALVRHPYDSLASWEATFDHLRLADVEAQPFGGLDDPSMTGCQKAALREIAATECLPVRRALWWRFLVTQLLDAGNRVRWLRYEDFMRAPHAMAELLMTDAPLPELRPLRCAGRMDAPQRELVAGVLCEMAERLQYVL